MYYSGSQLLLPIALRVGLSLDKVNFIACQLLCLALGYAYRHCCTVKQVGRERRMLFGAFIGLALLYFCNGLQLLHLFVQSGVAWLLIRLLPAHTASQVVFVWSMFYLSANHIYRQIYDYGGYTLDVTGPLMIQTQKLTSLAFGIADGQLARRGQPIKGHRVRHFILDRPTLFEFFSYCYYFHGCLAGPFAFYTDFIAFINEAVSPTTPLTPTLIRVLLHAAVFGVVNIGLSPLLPYGWVVSEAFSQLSWWRRILFISAAFFVVRAKYYFAWSLAEAANIAAGFGYAGVNAPPGSEWRLLRNFDVRAIESGRSVKEIIDGWNIPTAIWLRESVYERAPDRHKTLLVFLCSALWHGFYPGYYCFFITFAVLTFAARRVRHAIRPHFQQNVYVFRPGIYDVLTAISANLAMNYAQGPFLLLEMGLSLRFWSAVLCVGHILACMILLLVPAAGRAPAVKLVQQLASPANSWRLLFAANGFSLASLTGSLQGVGQYMADVQQFVPNMQQCLDAVRRVKQQQEAKDPSTLMSPSPTKDLKSK